MTALLVPQRHAITAEEYLRMGEAGVFHPDARLELIEGEIIEMAPIGTRHAAIVGIFTNAFPRLVGDRALVWVQNPVIAGPRSVPQPDVLLVKPRADFYKTAHPRPEDVLLAIEVADSTLAFDLKAKLPLYARAGICETWVVDVDGSRVHVFRDPESAGYKSSFVASVQETLAVATLPDVRIDLKTLF